MSLQQCVYLGSCVNQARLSLGKYLSDSLVSLVRLGWISLGLGLFSAPGLVTGGGGGGGLLLLKPNLLYKDFLAWFSARGRADCSDGTGLE